MSHLFEQDNFQITPNIIKRGQQLNFSRNIKAQYEIYNLQGKRIQQGDLIDQNYLEISASAGPGVVFLKINRNGILKIEKVLIR